MPPRRSTGSTAERLVAETLRLIEEKGSSRGVNLREISRRVGCAHTNVYNYFESFDGLLWAAFDEVLRMYREAMVRGLGDEPTPGALFRRLVSNLAGFALDNPGLYRFIGSDPLEPERIPADVIERVVAMKRHFLAVVGVLCGDRVGAQDVEELGNILLAYLDGETFNIINGRLLPGEDPAARLVDRATRLFRLLTAETCDGIDLTVGASSAPPLPTPEWEGSA